MVFTFLFVMKNSTSSFQDKWFPKNTAAVDYDLRNREAYLQENSKTTRLFKSPIFYMRNLQNSL